MRLSDSHALVDHAHRRVAVVRDEAAPVAPAPGVHEALVAQRDERLAGRDDGDAEAAGELGFARQALAVAQHAGHDRVGEALLDELGAARAVERREDDRARGVGAAGGLRHPTSRHSISSVIGTVTRP